MQEPTQMPPTSVLSVWELFYEVLRHPVQGLRAVIEQSPLVWAIAIIVLMNFVNTLATWTPESPSPFFGILRARSDDPITTALLSIPTGLIAWLVLAALVHGLSRLFGGQGGYLSLLCANAFATLPSIFAAPIAALSRSLGGAPRDPLEILGTVATGLWALVLGVLAVRENYRFSTGRAIIVGVVLPLVILGAIFVAAILIFPDLLWEVMSP